MVKVDLLNGLNQQTLSDLDDLELLHRIDEIVSRFDELDPKEAGDTLGALVQEFGERHSPDKVLDQFRRLLLEQDPGADPARQLDAIRRGMELRAATRAAGLTSART